MDDFATDQFNHYNIYPLECDEPDPYFWEYEQERIAWMEEAFLAVLSEFWWYLDQYTKTIKRTGEE